MKRLFIGALAALLMGCNGPQVPLMSVENFQGEVDGKPVSLYTLKNGEVQMQVTNFGARIVSIFTPDKKGKSVSIVVGRNNLQDYVTPPGE
ncbi:MAG: galactose-1-epimerase, partial [Bacteroidales bacterium]|nr:galactose-1-epimerase [Bacteroidales bacterium]